MKKIIFVFSLFVALAISYSFVTTDSSQLLASQSNIENADCKYGQCHATAESTGNRCKHCVSKDGDAYCWQH